MKYNIYMQALSFSACDRTRPHTRKSNYVCDRSHARTDLLRAYRNPNSNFSIFKVLWLLSFPRKLRDNMLTTIIMTYFRLSSAVFSV